jgi:hypothetical protein
MLPDRRSGRGAGGAIADAGGAGSAGGATAGAGGATSLAETPRA